MRYINLRFTYFYLLTYNCSFILARIMIISFFFLFSFSDLLTEQAYDSLFLLFSRSSYLQLLSLDLHNSSFLISRLLAESVFFLLYFCISRKRIHISQRNNCFSLKLLFKNNRLFSVYAAWDKLILRFFQLTKRPAVLNTRSPAAENADM